MKIKYDNIDVLGLGCVAVDYVGKIEKWPGEGQKLPLQSLSTHDGGLTGTAITAVARLRGKAAFAGKLGKSDAARRAIESLEKEGVDTSFVLRDERSEPVIAFVFTNSINGHRNIFFSKENVEYPMPSELPDEKWFDKIKVLLVDFESGLAGLEAAKIADEHGVPVVVDVERDEPYARELLSVSSHIVVPEELLVDFTGCSEPAKNIGSLKTKSDQTVVLTRGEKGCAVLTENDEYFEVPAFNVEVVDTTGCGDVFHGAYALAIARGQEVLEAVRFASAAAALTATKIGGRDGIPTAEQLQSFRSA
jgi:sugar/nucleoside kinase (ribokinase family)